MDQGTRKRFLREILRALGVPDLAVQEAHERGIGAAIYLGDVVRHDLSAEVSHQPLQFTGVPPRLPTSLNLDARAPSGHQHRRLERGCLPEIRERLEQREVRVTIRSDADYAQRVAMAQVGPGAVAHDEKPAADPLSRI